MLPSTAYLLSDAFRQSIQFSTATPSAPHSPVPHATIDHNTLSHAELANAVKTGGPHQFPEKDLPKIGLRLRKSGQFTAADAVDNHAKAIQAARQPPAAPVAQRPNLPAYAGVLSPNRKKAVMDFVNHANPDVQKHVADHQVHVPGLTPKEAYVRAQKAYDTFHAAHMGVPLATPTASQPTAAPQSAQQSPPQPGVSASAPQPAEDKGSDWDLWKNKGSRPPLSSQQRAAIGRKMGLTVGTPEDDAHLPKTMLNIRSDYAANAVKEEEPAYQKPLIDPSKYIPDRNDRLRLRTMEAWAFKTPEGKKAYDESGIEKLGMGKQHTEAFHQLYDKYHSGQQSAPPATQPAKQTPADVAKMHAEAVRSGRPVPPQYLDRVQKNLRAHGYHAEADQIAPKQDDAAYAADQFGSGTIPATTGITGAGMKRPGAPAPQRSFLNDESTGSPAKLPPRRPAPVSTPAEPLPAPKFGYSTHTAPAGVAPGEQSEQQPSTHGRFARLLDAARQGKLKEHVEGGLGNFFDKFERHGGKLLKKIGIDTGYNDEQEYSRVSAAIANLNYIVQEFARKSDPNQMSLFGGDEIALATAPKSKARNLRKPAPGQKSFNWDEDSHPREKDHHDGKRPGEFAPKESGHTSDAKQEQETEESAEKPEGNPDKRTYSAKGNEIYDEHGVRHAAFRTAEKAADAAERWNREGKPNSTPAAKAVEAKFPSLAGYVEPESKPEPAPSPESPKHRFHEFGDMVVTKDGVVGVMRGSGGMGSERVGVIDHKGNKHWASHSELTAATDDQKREYAQKMADRKLASGEMTQSEYDKVAEQYGFEKPETTKANPKSDGVIPGMEPEKPSETPREAAERQQKALDADYEFARQSAVRNAGEDLKGSARHKRNAWQGLDDAEKNGTAAELVTRDNLLKAEPHDLMSSADENPRTSLAGYFALRSFPAKPGATSKRVRTDDETAKKDRRQFLETYREYKSKIEELAKTESDPAKAIAEIRKWVGQKINELRGIGKNRSDYMAMAGLIGDDKYNNTANGLVDTYKSLGHRKTGVASRLQDFDFLAREKYGSEKPSTDDLAEHAKDIIEGRSMPDAFGAKGTKKSQFNASDAYVKHAIRKGGRDVSKLTKNPNEAAKHILEKFGARGVQWGNSVTDDERMHHASKLVESLADLADMTGLKPEDLSLGGKLGWAVGARGHGTASAHYEPGTQVINLTRKSGVGALAHEWAHAFDHSHSNYNIISDGEKRMGDYESGNWYPQKFSGSSRTTEDQTKKPLWQAYEAVRQAWAKSGFDKRLSAAVSHHIREGRMSKGKRDYWLSNHEKFARTFERFIQHKLRQNGRDNTYLSGLASTEGEHALWPNDEEIKVMAPAFEKLLSHYRKEKYGDEKPQEFSRSQAIAYFSGNSLNSAVERLTALSSSLRNAS